MITLLVVVSAAAALVLGVPLGITPLRRRIARTLAEAFATVRERARLRVAAVLLDLGNHLMLSEDERRARHIRSCLHKAGRRGRAPEDLLRRFGGRRADEVTFEALVGSRRQEGNPVRTLHLSCVVRRPPATPEGLPIRRGGEGWEPELAWRITNGPSPGYHGPITSSDIPNLERALISYHAAVLRDGDRRRFLDEGIHDHKKP